MKIKRFSDFLRKNSDSSKVRLFKGFFWNLLGDGFSKVLLMLTSVYIAGLLGPSDFGKWGVVQSTTMMFSIMLGFGIGVTSTKFVAENRTNNKHRAGIFLFLSIFFSIFLGIFLMLVMVYGADFLANDILKDRSLSSVIKLSSMFLFFNSVNGVIAGSLVGLEKFRQIAIANFFSSIVGAAIIVYLTKRLGLVGVVWGYTGYYFIADGLLIYFVLKEAKRQNIPLFFSIKALKIELKKFFSFSLAAFISAATGGPAVWGVYAIVANFKNGFIFIGIFNLAKILQNALIQFGAQINSPLISLMGIKENDRYVEKMNFALPWILVTLLAFPFICVPDMFTFFFKNSKYNVDGINLVVSLVAFTSYVILFKQGFARKIITGDLMWWGVWENILWAIGILALVPLLTLKLGLLGLPLAFSIAYFLDLLILIPFYARKSLIPKEILSRQSILIWGIVFLGLAGSYLNFPLVLRIGIFLVGCSGQIFMIYKLFFNLKLDESINY